MPAPWETQGGQCLSCNTTFDWFEADGESWEKNLCPNPSCGWDPENWRGKVDDAVE